MDKNVSLSTIMQHIQNELNELIRDYSNNNKNIKLKVNSIKGKKKIMKIL
jgi:ribosomal protein S3AE